METMFIALITLGALFLLKGCYKYFLKHKRPVKLNPMVKTAMIAVLIALVVLGHLYLNDFIVGGTIILNVAYTVLATCCIMVALNHMLYWLYLFLKPLYDNKQSTSAKTKSKFKAKAKTTS